MNTNKLQPMNTNKLQCAHTSQTTKTKMSNKHLKYGLLKVSTTNEKHQRCKGYIKRHTTQYLVRGHVDNNHKIKSNHLQ